MPIPHLTTLQYLILSCLIPNPQPGHAVRSMLREVEGKRRKRSDPSFYMLMGRMEKAKLIRGRYEQNRRIYRVTRKGTAAFTFFRRFVQKYALYTR